MLGFQREIDPKKSCCWRRVRVSVHDLVCRDAFTVMGNASFECHYSSKHAKLDKLLRQLHLDKVKALL